MSRLALLSSLTFAIGATATAAQDATSLPQLLRTTQVHDLAFDPRVKNQVLLATHNGLFTFDLETESIDPIGEGRQDFMGFAVDSAGVFYGSGHPERGRNSGVLASSNGGANWTLLSEGVDGPVDFHQMTVSPADPATLYGAFAGRLQRSQDAGATWEVVGPAPEGLIDLAGSALDSDTLYAATEAGLLKSADGGETWDLAHPTPLPVSFVETGPQGTLYAFIMGLWLVRADEETLDWTLVSEPLGGEYILHFATDGTRAVVTTRSGMLLVSDTGGESWEPLGD